MVWLQSFSIKINHDPLFCPIIYGPPLYTHFSALLFLAQGSESHIFCLLGVRKSVQDHQTPYTVHAFALVWHILSKGQFNRGKSNNKLLIGTLKTGDHGCLIEVTAKYKSGEAISRTLIGDRL